MHRLSIVLALALGCGPLTLTIGCPGASTGDAGPGDGDGDTGDGDGDTGDGDGDTGDGDGDTGDGDGDTGDGDGDVGDGDGDGDVGDGDGDGDGDVGDGDGDGGPPDGGQEEPPDAGIGADGGGGSSPDSGAVGGDGDADGGIGDGGDGDGPGDGGVVDGGDGDGDCDLGAAAGAGEICVDDFDGDNFGVIREDCDLAADPCLVAAETCVVAEGQASGFCGPDSCTSFYADECGAGTNCLVVGGLGECVAAGPAAAGEQCDANGDCVPGTVCLGSACVVPECSADNTQSPCADAGDVCAAFTIGGEETDIGSCFTQCSPFVATECEVGEFCNPVQDDDGLLEGTCQTSFGGTVPLGGDCSVDNCVDGAVCLDVEGTGVSSCLPLCDPNAAIADPGFCAGVGEVCAPLVSGPETLDYGFCREGCTPFAVPDTCAAAGEWCQPNFLDVTVGECVPGDGTAAVGASCGTLDGECCQETPGVGGCGADITIETCVCGLDTFCCDTEWDETCASIAETDCLAVCTLPPNQDCVAGGLCIGGTCGELCDPDAGDGEPGACGAGDACGGLVSGGSPLDIGQCTPSCDFRGGVDCVDAGAVCVTGEALSSDDDLCVVPDATVVGAPLNPGDSCGGAADVLFCGNNAVCLSDTCTGLCSETAAPFGANHPDCPVGLTTCTDTLGIPGLGTCE